MANKMGFLIFLIIFACTTHAQVKPNCYIVEKGTRFKVYQRSYLDTDANGKFVESEVLKIGIGEVVLLWAKTENYFVVSECNGRISLIDIKAKQTITEVSKPGIMGVINTDIKLKDGYVMPAGSCLWVIEIDVKNKLATAMIYEGKEITISTNYINFVTNTIEDNMVGDTRSFKIVQ
jgi:hypothetical protein